MPQSLSVTEDDYIHVQWSGSDFNTARDPNNAEGWRYADRANLVQTINENQQFPMADTKVRVVSAAASRALSPGLSPHSVSRVTAGLTPVHLSLSLSLSLSLNLVHPI